MALPEPEQLIRSETDFGKLPGIGEALTGFIRSGMPVGVLANEALGVREAAPEIHHEKPAGQDSIAEGYIALDAIKAYIQNCQVNGIPVEPEIFSLHSQIASALANSARADVKSLVASAMQHVSAASGQMASQQSSNMSIQQREQRIAQLWGKIDEIEEDTAEKMRKAYLRGDITQDQYEEYQRRQQFADSLAIGDKRKPEATLAAASYAVEVTRPASEAARERGDLGTAAELDSVVTNRDEIKAAEVEIARETRAAAERQSAPFAAATTTPRTSSPFAVAAASAVTGAPTPVLAVENASEADLGDMPLVTTENLLAAAKETEIKGRG